MSVRQARMPKPPEPLPGGDRTFNIEYISHGGAIEVQSLTG